MTIHQPPVRDAPIGQEPNPPDASFAPAARGGWTDAAVETLRALWADRALSAAVIARRLGVTRNAVLGKVHRLGLSDRGRGTRAPRPRPATARGPRLRRPAAPPPVVNRAAPVARRSQEPTPDPGPGLIARPEDLSVLACRWPIGDPKSQAFRFCGRRVWATPYCDAHRRIAFQARRGPGGGRC